jgi:hypothetical protein
MQTRTRYTVVFFALACFTLSAGAQPPQSGDTMKVVDGVRSFDLILWLKTGSTLDQVGQFFWGTRGVCGHGATVADRVARSLVSYNFAG